MNKNIQSNCSILQISVLSSKLLLSLICTSCLKFYTEDSKETGLLDYSEPGKMSVVAVFQSVD